MSSDVGEMLAERSSSASKEEEWERKERLETWDCLEYRRGRGGGRESSFLGAIILGGGKGSYGVPCDQAYFGRWRHRVPEGVVWACELAWQPGSLAWPGLWLRRVRVRGRVRVSLCGTSGPHARTWNARLSAVPSSCRLQEQPGRA